MSLERDLYDFYAFNALDREDLEYQVLTELLYEEFFNKFLLKWQQRIQARPYTTSEGGIWRKDLTRLLEKIRKMGEKGKKAEAIDIMTQAMHHTGPIIDFFDEKWLANALNDIFWADSPFDFWNKLSPKVRRNLYWRMKEIKPEPREKINELTKIVLMMIQRWDGKRGASQLIRVDLVKDGNDDVITGLRDIRSGGRRSRLLSFEMRISPTDMMTERYETEDGNYVNTWYE